MTPDIPDEVVNYIAQVMLTEAIESLDKSRDYQNGVAAMGGVIATAIGIAELDDNDEENA